MVAITLLALILASPTFAASASSQSVNWSGYLQYPATPADSWHQISSQFEIPLILCNGLPNGAGISMWVGVGGTGSDSQLFQAGVNSWCFDGEQVDDAWWTDEIHDDLPQYFTAPQPALRTLLGGNDLITVKLANTTTVNDKKSKIVRHVRHLRRWRIVHGRRVYEEVTLVRRHRVYFNVPVTTPGWSATVEDVTNVEDEGIRGAIWQGSDTSWNEPANASAEWIVEDPGCDAQGMNCAVAADFFSVDFTSLSDSSASGAAGLTPELVDEAGTSQTPQQNEFFCPTPIVGSGFVVDYQTSQCTQ